MSEPSPWWPGEHSIKHLTDIELTRCIDGFESWCCEDSMAKETMRKRRLVLLMDELDLRTS